MTVSLRGENTSGLGASEHPPRTGTVANLGNFFQDHADGEVCWHEGQIYLGRSKNGDWSGVDDRPVEGLINSFERLRSVPLRHLSSVPNHFSLFNLMFLRVSPNLSRRSFLVNGTAALRYNREFRFRIVGSPDVTC